MSAANDFSKLDAQSDVSRFAQMNLEEQAEFQAWCDERREEAIAAQSQYDDVSWNQ